MSYDLVQVIESGHRVVLSQKTGKTGSFARAVAFADRQTRMGLGQAMYAKWLQNGQFRPLAEDIMDTLVAKTARIYLSEDFPETGPISKDQLVSLCKRVNAAVIQSGKEVKGQKAFVYGLVQRIAETENTRVIEAA
jgi:hypothetical protein